MNTRLIAVAWLVLLVGSCSSKDAGIVLNVDTEVMADRTAISRLVVTVGSKKQEWTLSRPLPGSLGIQTSPGSKQVMVEGFAGSVLRGQWSDRIVTTKGSVVVQDVHLVHVGASPTDAGADASPDMRSVRDSSLEARDGNLGESGLAGRGGAGGRITLPHPIDGGTGGVGGTGGNTRAGGSDGGGSSGWDAGAADATDGSLPSIDGRPPVTAPMSGAFLVKSQFNVLATVAAPGPVGDVLDLAHQFVDDPGAAIIGFAEDAGVPGLSTLRSALPDVLESRLTGWMTSYIKSASVAGVTPFDELTWLDDTIRALLLYWGLDSNLTLPLETPGTHSPLALTFASPTGSPFSIPLDPTAPVTKGIGVTAVVSWPNGTAAPAVMTISDHFMGLPFGRYALQALNAILLAEYGAPNLTKFLSNAVGCPDMARYVASQCVDLVLDTVCVGHEGDLLSVCEGGLAEGAKQIENQIMALDLKIIHLQQGTATAIGAQVTRPQDVTALQNGLWTVTVDFGNGAANANATFTGESVDSD